eukprot:8008161-Lingulodinium_polyedra.AAC.1
MHDFASRAAHAHALAVAQHALHARRSARACCASALQHMSKLTERARYVVRAALQSSIRCTPCRIRN